MNPREREHTALLARARIARQMLSLDRKMTRLLALASELAALDEPLAALACHRSHRILKYRWWDMARELGVETGARAADIRALAQKVDAERRQYESA